MRDCYAYMNGVLYYVCTLADMYHWETRVHMFHQRRCTAYLIRVAFKGGGGSSF